MKKILLSLVVFCLTASAANAAVITTLANTGVDGSGTPRAHGSVGDLHYSLITVPGGTTVTKVLTSAGGFPIGPWIGDNGVSAWIGPNTTSANGPVGTYVYRTTFDLTGFDHTSASITGRWATDNPGTNIVINGNATGQTAAGFTVWTGFSVNSGFIAGVNTLDFVLVNLGGPTGLRVEMTGQANEVPEPGTLAIWSLLGLGGAFVSYRRRKVVGA